MSVVDWLGTAGHFVMLSLLSIGGAITVVPDMQRVLVQDGGLLTDAQFSASIAIAQASPGPNVLFVAVMGYQAGGLTGALILMTAIMLPSATLAMAAIRWGGTRADWRGVRAFKAGMAPIVIGLMLATAWVLAVKAPDWRAPALSVVAAILVWRTRLHTVALILAGGVIGALGLV